MTSPNPSALLLGTYCNNLFEYSRFLTREVHIGDIALGGHNPIRVQSMTTTDTMNTAATVAQTIRMVEAGCEYVRITAPSIKEAENLANIKAELRRQGYNVPLIADIHFTPNAAEVAARIIEKVRVNPGNYVDKKKFDQIDYTDAEYKAEIERIDKRFSPLVKICKEHGTAMRIGTNHGSLSDRIMSRYGDTPHGMVESAMEFMRICAGMDYHNLVISMKSSNPQVMVQAYRLLVKTMVAEGMNYPLHLGVTEAGDGEDGRIKSALGIGTLLEDGLGDTIRVSLTEEPEYEAPVAAALAQRYSQRAAQNTKISPIDIPSNYHPYEYNKRQSTELNTFIGGHQAPRVIIDISNKTLTNPNVLEATGYIYSPILDKYNMAEVSVDFVYLADKLPSFTMPGNLKQLYNYNTWNALKDKQNCHPVYALAEWCTADEKDKQLNFIQLTVSELMSAEAANMPIAENMVLILSADSAHIMPQLRSAFFYLENLGWQVPVIVKAYYNHENIAGKAEFLDSTIYNLNSQGMLHTATDVGGLLLDGYADGLWLWNAEVENTHLVSASFGLLQATRSRISRTEYISCPSCGRTLFDLQETTLLIRSRTNHLKGVKIAIMGCIVNGPGEMADADYGYVGAGPDQITLYRGKEVVKKNVATALAVDELINIIRADGNWVELETINN